MIHHYEERYGQWAGDERGREPDYSRCCKSVMRSRSYVSYQCAKPNGHGPDGAYCKQHDPAAVQRRNEERAYTYALRDYERAMARLRANGALALIQAIAQGHNDPRRTCTQWLATNAPVAPVRPAHMASK